MEQRPEFAFQIEHSQLLLAIKNSLDRESNLHRQLIMMKKHLTSISTRFQVSTKLTRDDYKSLMNLQNEAFKAKVDELVATKQAEEAHEIIQSLRLEISSLKRTIRDIQTERSQRSSHAQEMDNLQADIEVDKMIQSAAKELSKDSSFKGLSSDKVLSYHEWKLKQFVEPPPPVKDKTAEENHIVSMLAAAATRESLLALSQEASVVAKIRSGKKVAGVDSRTSLPAVQPAASPVRVNGNAGAISNVSSRANSSKSVKSVQI